MSRKLVAAAAAFIVSASIFHGVAAADVTVTYRFTEPSIEDIDGGFSRIVFPGTRQAGRTGEPGFPFKGAAVLLRPGEAASSVVIERRGWRRIGEKMKLYPSQPPVPGATAADEAGGGLLLREDVYAQDRWIYPPGPEMRTRYLRGHPVATGAFSPVGYNPASGEAGYWSEISITVVTTRSQESAAAERLLRTDESTVSRLAALVDNKEAVPLAETARAAEGGYDYLIITAADYEAEMEPLEDFYNRRGIMTQIMTIEEIGAYYSGLDLADEIRQAITDEYVDSGVSFVLLAGDSDGSEQELPHRGLYCAVESSVLYRDSDIPADIYYAALDGDWNGDGDTRWGEQGEEDFYCEVAVGRITFNTLAEAAALINKISMYQESPVASQCDDALMLGERLYNDPVTWGGDELDQLIGAWDIHGFVTSGIPPSHDIVKYYDRDLPYTWDVSTVYSGFNAGVNLVCHEGHTNQTYAMRMSTTEVTAEFFTNDGITAGFPVINTIGCYAGSFAGTDCIAEKMLSIETCASAFVGNSRYGWFTEGTTNGPSHHFQREFFDAVFTEGITRIGEANVRSKDETVPFVDLPDEYEPGAHRWCFYCLNVLGDPALDIWTSVPTAITASHATALDRDAASFAVSTDAPGSTGSLYAGGVCYGAAAAGPDGSIYIPLASPPPAGTDTLVLTVTAHDRLVYRTDVAVTDYSGDEGRTPRLVLSQNSPNPFNPATVIRFILSAEGYVDLRVYDAAGREVAVLAERTMAAGGHEMTWNAAGLSSGVYFYVLRAEGRTLSRKAILLR